MPQVFNIIYTFELFLYIVMSMKNIFFTLLRLIVEFFVVAIVYFSFSSDVLSFEDNQSVAALACQASITVVFTLGLYVLIEKFFEKRSLHELFSLSKIYGIFNGFLVGTVYMSLTVGIIALLGCYTVEGYCFDWYELYRFLIVFLVVAVGEEVLFRGILYKRIASICNPSVALVISGLIFGLVHIGNDNATLWSSIAIALEAGTLLAAAYMWSKNLLFPIGIHWAWNFVQGYVYGSPVSGNEVACLMSSSFSGNEYISGGDFGPEASVIAVVIGIIFTWFFIRESNKKKA